MRSAISNNSKSRVHAAQLIVTCGSCCRIRQWVTHTSLLLRCMRHFSTSSADRRGCGLRFSTEKNRAVKVILVARKLVRSDEGQKFSIIHTFALIVKV